MSVLRFSTGRTAAALALALLGGAAGLAAQQPTTAPPAAAKLSPRDAILKRVKQLDARPDTVHRDSAAADSAGIATPTAGDPGRAATASVHIEEDSIMKALSLLGGYTATEYTGKAARFVSDTGKLVLTGPAQVTQGAQAMTAESTLIYNENTQVACGFGKPVLTGAGQSNPVSSDQVCYDVDKRLGVAFGARTKFQEGATAWYVDGHKVYLSGSDNVFGRDAEFTDCDLTQPHYHFTARELKIVRGRVLVARDVTLSFADVPVFWLPFMLQSMEQGRRTGLLMPRFDLNDIARTNANYQRRIQNVGFYWATNEHLGTLLSMDWFSNNYTALHGAFDYSFKRQFLEGGLEARQYWRQNGSTEMTLGARNGWRPDERTNVQLNVSYATSSSFVLAQSFDPRELNRSIDSNLALQRRFDFGSLDFSGRRQQYLQTDRVTMTLPSVSFSPMPVSLFKRADGSALLTWNGNGSYTATRVDGTNYQLSPDPSTRNASGSLGSSLNLGKLSWSQSFNYTDDRSLLRPVFQRTDRTAAGKDTVVTVDSIPARARGQVGWSTSLSFQQRLIGTSSITPNLSISGQSISVDTGNVHTGMVAGPRRMDFGASTQMDVYGFWPGVGPFSRVRHKLSPSFSYGYSPAIDPSRLSALQAQVFGRDSIRERNSITIGLNQTFEAKYRESAKPDSSAPAQDTTTNLEGEPRRLPQARKMTLLSLSTSSVAYDFTNDPRTGRRIGFQAPTMTNTVASDLIPGLQFTLTHDLFIYSGPDSLGTSRPRHFSPFLTNASTSFSLNDKSWVFRMLGLASHAFARPDQEIPTVDTATSTTTAAAEASQGLGQSIVPGAHNASPTPTTKGIGSWNASFTYDLSRQRPSGLPSASNGIYTGCSPIFGGCSQSSSTQMVRGNLSFQPTTAWRVQWQTGYSFSDGRFADHVLTFSRDLHDWEANFDFIRAQNGNFSFSFRVSLKAQPDLKFDYSQRGGDSFQQINNGFPNP